MLLSSIDGGTLLFVNALSGMPIFLQQLLFYGAIVNFSIIVSMTHDAERFFIRISTFFCILAVPFMLTTLGQIDAPTSDMQSGIPGSIIGFVCGPIYLKLILSLGFIMSLCPLLAKLWKRLWLSVGKASVRTSKGVRSQVAQKKPPYRNAHRGIFRD